MRTLRSAWEEGWVFGFDKYPGESWPIRCELAKSSAEHAAQCFLAELAGIPSGGNPYDARVLEDRLAAFLTAGLLAPLPGVRDIKKAA